MNMLRSIIALLVILIAVSIKSFFIDAFFLSPLQLHMLEISGCIMISVALLCFVVAELTRNFSQVDKLWSIIPVVYMWYYAYSSGWDARILLMTACITIWGIRLTFNFARKGGYQLRFWAGEEDYRWEVLRNNSIFKDQPLRWRLFSFFFIALYQNFLLWAITLPAIAASAGDSGIGLADYLIAFVLIALVVIETIADQQQWNYQTEKCRRKNAGEKLNGEYAIGFIRTGLFAYSRHPNYASEQLIWLVLCLFSVNATGSYISWSMIGSILLLILFQGSADFSEKISAAKYPAYGDYMKQVPMFLNRLW